MFYIAGKIQILISRERSQKESDPAYREVERTEDGATERKNRKSRDGKRKIRDSRG